MKYLILFLSFAICLNSAVSQDFQPKGSFKGFIKIPIIAANYAQKKLYKGIIDVSAQYQHNVWKGLTFGAGIKYTLFNLNEFALDYDITGQQHIVGLYGKIGYERFVNDRISIEFGVRGGYTGIFNVNDSCKTKHGGAHSIFAPFIEPTVGAGITAGEGRIAFSLNIGYAIIFNKFDNHSICIEDLSGYYDDQYTKFSQLFTLGFGTTFYFNKPRSTVGR